MSVGLESGVVVVSAMSTASNVYLVSKGSGFSEGSGNSQFATLKTS
ncbi:hypothetical protein H2273_07575, partial [Campylobacter sp. W0047]|nr:hypothetical protein [Campylobacter sp. W0047]